MFNALSPFCILSEDILAKFLIIWLENNYQLLSLLNK